MNVHTVDFEEVIKKFQPYVDQMMELDQYKMKHYTEIDSIKKEMESIINASKTGLILDENIKQQYMMKFKDLQTEGVNKENSFRSEVGERQSKIMEDSFNQITDIIDEYSKKAKIDMIISKSQVVFVRKEYDITDIIIDVIKEKNLYHNEKEKESV